MKISSKLDDLTTTEFIATNGVRLHCIKAGQGEPIILLHGFPEHWYSWRYQIPALARYGQVLAPDMRGYNLSDKPAGVQQYDIDKLADDVAGIIDHCQARQAYLAGHDWGGAVAWWTAIRHPARIKKLAVMNCPHPIAFQRILFTTDQLFRSWYMFFFQLPWLPERFVRGRDVRVNTERAFRGTAARPEYFTDEDIDRLAAAIDQPGALTAMINYYRAGFRRSLTLREVPPIELPVMLIWGEQDRFLVRRNTENLSRWVKDLTVRYLPRAAHWVQQEEPDEVNRLLTEFFFQS